MLRRGKLFLSVALGLGLLAFGASAPTFGAAEPPAPLVLRLKFRGALTPALAELTRNTVQEARKRDAALILVELNSSGGLASSVREMVRAIGESDVPVALWIGPHGAKASGLASLLVLASHITSMSEGARLIAPEHLPEWCEGRGEEGMLALAKKREKNPELWKAFFSRTQGASASEALSEGWVELNSRQVLDLLTELDGRMVPLRLRGQGKVRSYRRLALDGARVEERNVEGWSALLQWVSQPDIATLLLGVGLLFFLVELSVRGAGLAGMLGGASLFAALLGFQMLPLRADAALVLIAGLGLPVTEILLKRRGLLSIPGGVALAWALHALVDLGVHSDGVALPLSLGVGCLAAGLPILFQYLNRVRS